jgi:broad specificity phosphatase PhoE
MSELFLVRHAQASFGEDDYDRLSTLGHQQSQWLGEYFKSRNIQFDLVICGEMLRHRQTFDGMVSGMGLKTTSFETHPQWNEFDFEALVEAYLSTRPQEKPAPGSPKHELFLVLRKALLAWANDQIEGEVPETWADFEQRVSDGVLKATQESGSSSRILVISSGGAISMAIRQVLRSPVETMIQMNLQTRNSSYSHLFFNERSIQLSGFNHVPHLDHPDRSDAVTYY